MRKKGRKKKEVARSLVLVIPGEAGATSRGGVAENCLGYRKLGQCTECDVSLLVFSGRGFTDSRVSVAR